MRMFEADIVYRSRVSVSEFGGMLWIEDRGFEPNERRLYQ